MSLFNLNFSLHNLFGYDLGPPEKLGLITDGNREGLRFRAQELKDCTGTVLPTPLVWGLGLRMQDFRIQGF